MTSRTALAAFLAIACSLTLPAVAQDKLSRTELTALTAGLGVSVEELQSRNEQLQVQNADIALQMRELEGQNAQLTGRIETLQFQLGQSRDEMNRLQSDDQEIGRQLTVMADKIAELETRLARRDLVLGVAGVDEQANVANLLPTDPGSTVQTGDGEVILASDLPGEAGPLFADGKARLLNFDFKGAERSFRTFLEQYGNDQQAGEAQYWLGEVLFQQQSYAESGAAFSDMIRNFPEDMRAPDGLVKLGRSLRFVGDNERACAVLGTLSTRYPDASPVTRNLADVERSRSGCSA